VIRHTRILPRFYFVAGGIEVSFPISHSPSQNERVVCRSDNSADRAYVTCGEPPGSTDAAGARAVTEQRQRAARRMAGRTAGAAADRQRSNPAGKETAPVHALSEGAPDLHAHRFVDGDLQEPEGAVPPGSTIARRRPPGVFRRAPGIQTVGARFFENDERSICSVS